MKVKLLSIVLKNKTEDNFPRLFYVYGAGVEAAPIPDQENTRGGLCDPAGTQIVSPASVVPDGLTG